MTRGQCVEEAGIKLSQWLPPRQTQKLLENLLTKKNSKNSYKKRTKVIIWAQIDIAKESDFKACAPIIVLIGILKREKIAEVDGNGRKCGRR